MESESFASVWDAIEATPEAAAEMKRRSAITRALQEHLTSAGMIEPQACGALHYVGMPVAVASTCKLAKDL